MNNKYNMLNVLNIQNRIDGPDAVDQVAALINSKAKSPSQRKRLERALGKVNTIYKYAQDKVNKDAYEQYQAAVDKNFLHFFGILALTMKEDYFWREDDNHDQISSLLERMGKKIDKYANKGFTTEDIVKQVDEEIGIMLVPDQLPRT